MHTIDEVGCDNAVNESIDAKQNAQFWRTILKELLEVDELTIDFLVATINANRSFCIDRGNQKIISLKFG